MADWWPAREDDCQCKIGSLCTYAFEVEETATSLKMRDNEMAVGAARCLIGVIKFNHKITSVDLSGCGICRQRSAVPLQGPCLQSDYHNFRPLAQSGERGGQLQRSRA